MEEAIRASLQDYSHEDIQRAKSVDAIEQANEDALQRAILQSMQESGGGGGGGGAASSSLRATATMTTTTTMTSSQRLAASSSSSMSLTGGSPRAVPISRVNPPQQQQQQQQSVRSPQPPPAGLARMNSANSANGAAFHQNQPYRPGPFPPEPPPQMPYYQVQYQQTLQQQQQYHPSDAYAYEDGGYDEAPPPPAPMAAANVSARSQMMMGMMMRHSYDDRDDGHGHGAAGDDYDDEYMQPASYANTPQQPQQPYGPGTLRQQPSSQFISVGNGQGRSSGTGMRDPNNPNNDGETVVSSTSSGAGIGRNTAAQVTSLYLNNPDLIEQEMQQRYQRQYQLYLQQQLAQADVANQRLASTSQDAYDQIQQHHGGGGGGGSGKAPPLQQQPQQSVARAVFEAAPDQPPTMYPGGGPMRQQSSQRQRISSQHQMSQQQTPHDEDQDDNQTRNSSGNLSGGTGTSAARRLSQTQSFIGNPLMQSRISAVAHHQQQQQQQQHQPPQQQQQQPQSQQPMSQAAAGSLQSPNQAAFMEKLRRKSGSYGPTGGANDSVEGNANGPANGGFSSYPDDSHRGSYQPQQQSPPPPGYDGPMTSSGKSQGASSLTMSTKSTSGSGGRSFHVPRASFHQFVDGVEVPMEAANGGFNDAAFHPHGGHHQLGVHHEAPHRLSKHEVLVERDEYGIPLTVDEKHHPHLHQLKATLSQTQMSLSSDSDDDDDDDDHGKQLRPRVGSNGNMQRPSLTNIAVPAAAAFPTATPNGGKTMKKTFSAPKMIDTHNEDSPATTPVAAKATARPGLYDRNLVESVDLDPSKIKVRPLLLPPPPRLCTTPHAAVCPTPHARYRSNARSFTTRPSRSKESRLIPLARSFVRSHSVSLLVSSVVCCFISRPWSIDHKLLPPPNIPFPFISPRGVLI